MLQHAINLASKVNEWAFWQELVRISKTPKRDSNLGPNHLSLLEFEHGEFDHLAITAG